MLDLQPLLAPRGIALIGASPDPAIIRGRIVRGVRHLPYEGDVVAVSRSHDTIEGVRVVAKTDALPEGLDLAVIAVPAEHVAGALRGAIERGIRAAVVISSGFAEERGEDGRRREAELVDIAREAGVVLCGPNAEGFLNAALPLAATFSPAAFELAHGEVLRPSAGGAVAVVSQSGGIGFSFLNRGAPAGVPFSHVISTGNEAALDSLTLVEWLLEDEATGVVMMFVEGLRRPERLAGVARRATELGKTIVVAKMGRSEAGAAAAASHTASLAGGYRAFEAVARHAGLVVAEDQDHAVGLLQALTLLGPRRPAGRRMGVLTPSGGAGIWLADMASEAGLTVPELDGDTRSAFDELLPAYGASRNPVDVTAQFIFKHGFARALELMCASPAVDGMLVASSMIHAETFERDAANLARVAPTLDKPVFFVAYTNAHPRAVEILTQAGFPVFTSAVTAARTMHTVATHHAARMARLADGPATPEPAGAPTPAPPSGTGTLSESATREWLNRGGVDSGVARLAGTPDEAVEAWRALGTPVAMKLQAPLLTHKSDVGAVRLGIDDERGVRAAFAALLAIEAQHVEGIQVTAMADDGVDLIVGVQVDELFGPLLLLGSGGVLVELVGDTILVPLPTTRDAIHHALMQLRVAVHLGGYRGAEPADVDALCTFALQLARFAEANADALGELELNPVRVHRKGSGISVLDALARLSGQPAASVDTTD